MAAVDRSYGANVLVGVAVTLIGAVVVHYIHDVFRLVGGVILGVLLLWAALYVRRKRIRDRCTICGSEVETHFLAASLSAIEWERRYNIRRREGPVCRVCTDLPSDRASEYPRGTKFGDVANEWRECCQCHRTMRRSFLEPCDVPINDDEERSPDGWVRARECGWICRFPQSKTCEKIVRKRTQLDPHEVACCPSSIPTGPRSPQSPTRDP
jgi:hypothetical protein